MKRCTRCKQAKPVDAFSRNRRRKDGLNSHCKTCVSETYSEWYQDNRAAVIKKVADWRTSNLERARASERDTVRRQRSADPLDQGPTPAYLRALELDPCAYCGAFSWPRGQVDHITPSANGGTNDWTNLIGACPSCNKAKGNRHVLAFLAQRINPAPCAIDGCERRPVAKGLCNTHWMQQYRAKKRQAA